MVRSINGCPVSEFYKNPYLVSKAEGKEEEESVISLHNNPSLRMTDLPEELILEFLKGAAGLDRPRRIEDGKEIPSDAQTLCAIRGVCRAWRRISDDVLGTHWHKLRGSQIPLLGSLTNAIHDTIGSFECSHFFRLYLLTKEFRRMGVPIPDEDRVPVLGFQALQYVEAHQKLLDISLKMMWLKIQEQIDFGQDPVPATAAAIRLWLNDPANAERLAQITHLELSGLGLKILPAEISKCTQLEYLYLDNNQLVNLPAEIGECTQLQRLHLDGNRLVNLPAEIGKCAQLLELHLNGNQLVNLPAEIGKCTQLQRLSLNYNQLVNLPAEIGKCTQLQWLHLDGNRLVNLPPEIGKCTQLRVLYLDYNQLVNLPPEIGKCTQLEYLYLDNNQLVNLPPEIGKCTQLEYLYLDNNQLVNLPAEIGECTQLRRLSLNGNQLVNLPAEIGKCTQLQWLHLDGNRLVNLPAEIGKCARLRKLYLNGNPLMFTFNKDPSEIKNDKKSDSEFMAVGQYLAWLNLPCQSPLAALCQGILREEDNEILQQHFERLPFQIQEQIRSKWAAIPSSSSSSSSQVEGDLFGNRALLVQAMTSVLREKFFSLSEQEKEMVYRRVAELAGHSPDNISWGRDHAEENMIRFVDAMAEFIN